MKLTLAFQEKLSQHTRDNLDKSFLNLSTCSLHPVYTAFRRGITNIFFDLDQFFTDIHFLFGLSSIRREDYRGLHFLINTLDNFVIKHVETSNCSCCWTVGQSHWIFPEISSQAERCLQKNHCTKNEIFQGVSSVNVTKSTGNCVFGHIYWGNP